MPDPVVVGHEAHKSIEYLAMTEGVKGQWQEEPEPHQVTSTAFNFRKQFYEKDTKEQTSLNK
jgi:hypothetical protein